MEEISPCPFCGNNDPYWDNILIDETEHQFLTCADCGCEGPNDPTHVEAARKWNARV